MCFFVRITDLTEQIIRLCYCTVKQPILSSFCDILRKHLLNIKWFTGVYICSDVLVYAHQNNTEYPAKVKTACNFFDKLSKSIGV